MHVSRLGWAKTKYQHKRSVTTARGFRYNRDRDPRHTIKPRHSGSIVSAGRENRRAPQGDCVKNTCGFTQRMAGC